MTDEDATRIMEVPFEVLQHAHRENELVRKGRASLDPQLRSPAHSDRESDFAQTPCVGVASMGNTHFGETRFGPEPEPVASEVRTERSSTLPAVRQHKLGKATATLLQKLETSRPLSQFLGLCVGVGAALLVLFVGRAEKPTRSPTSQSTVSLRVSVKESSSEKSDSSRGIAAVAVRAGNQVVVTDEDGTADFSDIRKEGGLLVEASCPDGYVGGRLSRTFTPAVLRSSSSWSLELVCEPEFVQVEIVVQVEGCGEMNVFLDGILVGVTEGGEYRTLSRTYGESAVELRVEPLSGACQVDKTRTVALSRAESVVEVSFQGVRPKPRRIKRDIPKSEPRPYRL